jgi:hypothetical protein
LEAIVGEQTEADGWTQIAADYEARLAKAETERNALVKALEFYRDGWKFKTHRNRPGLEWYAIPELLDDCGNIARQALARTAAQGNGDGK